MGSPSLKSVSMMRMLPPPLLCRVDRKVETTWAHQEDLTIVGWVVRRCCIIQRIHGWFYEGKLMWRHPRDDRQVIIIWGHPWLFGRFDRYADFVSDCGMNIFVKCKTEMKWNKFLSIVILVYGFIYFYEIDWFHNKCMFSSSRFIGGGEWERWRSFLLDQRRCRLGFLIIITGRTWLGWRMG